MSHCESCGRENPGTDEGYTGCCNEPLCDGRIQPGEFYGTLDIAARACCWARAFNIFANMQIEVPEGSSRIHPTRPPTTILEPR